MEESHTKVDVVAATCNRRQEPVITRQQEECPPLGADCRTDGEKSSGVFLLQPSCPQILGSLTRVVIGWDIEDKYVQQVCYFMST